MTRFFFILCMPVAYTLGDELQRNIPDAEAALITQAKELRLDRHDLGGAESILKSVLQRYPDYYKAHYNLGLVYHNKNDEDAAIAELEKARMIRETENLSDYSIYNTLGWTYMMKGDTEKAESNYMIALKYEAQNTPDSNTRLYNNLGWFYYNLGKPDEADKYIDIAANKYNSKSATELKRLVEQLRTDKQKINAKSASSSVAPTQTPHL